MLCCVLNRMKNVIKSNTFNDDLTLIIRMLYNRISAIVKERMRKLVKGSTLCIIPSYPMYYCMGQSIKSEYKVIEPVQYCMMEILIIRS